MSENNTTNIKIGFSLDPNSLNKTTQEVQKEFDKLFQNSNIQIEKTFQKFENILKKTGVDYSKDKVLIEAGSRGQIKGSENARNATHGLIDKYWNKVRKLAKEAYNEEIDDNEDVVAKKIKDYLNYTQFRQKVDKETAAAEAQSEKETIAKQKEQKKQLEKEYKDATAKIKADEATKEKERIKKQIQDAKDLKAKEQAENKIKRDEERRVQEQKRRTYRFYSSTGRGVGGLIGGARGALIGQSIGELGGEIATGGNIIGGALGLAITVLTEAIMHLSKVMDKAAETGYNAESLGTSANKLNAFKMTAKSFGLQENDVMPAITSIGKNMAALNFRGNGTYSGSTAESLQFANIAHRLHVPLTNKDGSTRDSMDIMFDLLHSPEWENQGFSKDAKNSLLSKIMNTDFLKTQRLIDQSYQDETNRNAKVNNLTNRTIDVSKNKQFSSGRGTNDISTGFGTNLVDKGVSGFEKLKNKWNLLKQQTAENYGISKGHNFRTAEEALLSADVLSNQIKAESSGNRDAIGKPFWTKNGYDQAFGLFQISRNTANLPKVLDAMGRKGKPFSDKELLDPMLNKKLHDFITKDNLKYLVATNPSLKHNQTELAKQELIMYNHGIDALHTYQKTGYVKGNYQDQILVNIHIDARGNPNSDEIAKKTAQAVKDHTAGKRNVVMNNQPSTRA